MWIKYIWGSQSLFDPQMEFHTVTALQLSTTLFIAVSKLSTFCEINIEALGHTGAQNNWSVTWQQSKLHLLKKTRGIQSNGPVELNWWVVQLESGASKCGNVDLNICLANTSGMPSLSPTYVKKTVCSLFKAVDSFLYLLGLTLWDIDASLYVDDEDEKINIVHPASFLVC